MIITFSVPLESDLIITKGQDVDFNTPLLRQAKDSTVEIDLAAKLSTNPKNIFRHLKKFVGETIGKGDLIAEASSFLSSKSYYSETGGVIKEVDHTRGVLVLETAAAETDTVMCYFKGTVTDIDKNIIKLKVEHAKEYELASSSESFGGPVLYSQNPEKGHLGEEEVSGRVVVDDNLPTYEQTKYDALGAIGFVYCKLDSVYTKSARAQLKNEHDYKTVISSKLPYCIIDRGTNTICFYE